MKVKMTVKIIKEKIAKNIASTGLQGFPNNVKEWWWWGQGSEFTWRDFFYQVKGTKSMKLEQKWNRSNDYS